MITTSTDAFFLIDKPAGVTSFDAVQAVSRVLRTRRVGHTGTLDPFATGLLVVLSGQGTRLASHVPDEPKVYLAHIAFGAETTTDDLTGDVTARAPVPTIERIKEAIATLTGDFSQTPPAYSAKKIDGTRAYALARKGIVPNVRPVDVHVQSWEILDWQGSELTVRITCRRGTYIRALARDLGRSTESAAHCSFLRRERCGPFDVVAATSWDALRDGDLVGRPLLDALGDMERVALSDHDAARAANGMSIPASGSAQRAALLFPDGRLLGLGRRDHEYWHPHVVLAHA